MSQGKEARRLSALRRFQDLVTEGGFASPLWEDLENIAATDGTWPTDLVDASVVEPWRRTIEVVLQQVKFGVHDPVSQLPEDLRQPAGFRSENSVRSMQSTKTQASGSGASVVDDQIAALREWRDRELASGGKEVTGLTDNKITQIVRSGRRSAETLAPVLNELQSLAPEVLGILNGELKAETSPASSKPNAHESERDDAASQQPGTTPARGDSWEGEPSIVDQFVEYPVRLPQREPLGVSSVAVDEGFSLSWARLKDADGVVVYRVVSDDEAPPYSPDRATFVGSTLEDNIIDKQPLMSAVRYIGVWAYAGSTRDEAVTRQPELHARAGIVSPVTDVRIQEDEGRVVGQWSARPGIEKVRVFRIPSGRPVQASDVFRYEIQDQHANLGGFVDAEAGRGASYEYRIRAEAMVAGVRRLSSHVSELVAVSASLSPILDLSITLHQDIDRPRFDLHWTAPPTGRVFIYRTQRPPAPGVEEKPLAESALIQAGLATGDRLVDPHHRGENGREAMTGVPWPRDWNRTYFTPVTVFSGMARAGTTVSETSAGYIERPRIVERVHEQVLTFGWPAGAASVQVYRGPRGQSARMPLSGQRQEISAAMYERMGGLHLKPVLPAKGCALHIVPLAYAKGHQVVGTIATVDYAGLIRLAYTVDRDADVATIRIRTELELAQVPPLTLVHNADRMPLATNDGLPLAVAQAGNAHGPQRSHIQIANSSAGVPSAPWEAKIRDLSGFIRLFVDLPELDDSAAVALLDPPVSCLRLPTPTKPQR